MEEAGADEGGDGVEAMKVELLAGCGREVDGYEGTVMGL